jgi:hypothetical protein
MGTPREVETPGQAKHAETYATVHSANISVIALVAQQENEIRDPPRVWDRNRVQ